MQLARGAVVTPMRARGHFTRDSLIYFPAAPAKIHATQAIPWILLGISRVTGCIHGGLSCLCTRKRCLIRSIYFFLAQSLCFAVLGVAPLPCRLAKPVGRGA